MPLDRGSYYADSSTPAAIATISAAMADAEADQFGTRQIQSFRPADSAALAALASTYTLQEGDKADQLDTDEQWRYSGSAWAKVAAGGSTMLSHQAFSGTSLAIDNLFTTDYLNYDVVVNLNTTSAATGITVLMRASGTDYTTGNHVNRRLELNGATPAYVNSTTGTGMLSGRANGAGGGLSKFVIGSPQAAEYTKMSGQSHDAAISQIFWNSIPTTTAYTGMKVLLDGVVTGAGFVTVYGLRK